MKSQDIIRAVCRRYEINEDRLFSRTRRPGLAFPRQVAMYLHRELLGYSYARIAKIFVKKDHTTVLAACRAVEHHIQTNKLVWASVAEIRATLVADSTPIVSVCRGCRQRDVALEQLLSLLEGAARDVTRALQGEPGNVVVSDVCDEGAA